MPTEVPASAATRVVVSAARLAAFALDPGLMPGTGLARSSPLLLRVLWHTVLRAVGLVLPGGSTAARSGAAVAWLATVPELAGTSGRYVDVRRREITGWYGSDRPDWSDDLYTTSLALCGIAPDPLRSAA